MSSIHSAYDSKPAKYFTGARTPFIDSLPSNPEGRLLEIGCGNGVTSAYALSTGKCGWCAGVELSAGPAAEAAKKLTQVIVGDVESLELSFPEEHFDVLVMSEVIEHLRDPWAVLGKLRKLLKPGAIVLAGSPNVAHYRVIRNLLRERFEYTEMGVMDKTHLRWFTPQSYRRLFEDCGFEVESVSPPNPLSTRAAMFNRLTLGRWQHLLHHQIMARARRRD